MPTQGSTTSFIYAAGISALLLFFPYTAMQWTSSVNWQVDDFMLAGLLLCSAILAVGFD
jgi:hypothetical protein